MNIIINGEKENIKEEKLSIAKLLEIKEVESPEMVSVQVNGAVVDRTDYGSTSVAENDEVDFLYFMGGGQ